MSVQTEISRLESAKEAIATAIAGKGVTVPNGTMLDGMAALIESIVAGGGEMQFVSGEFTPTSINLYNNPITISGIGFKPKILCVIVSSVSSFGALGKTYGRYLGSYFVHENGSGYAGRSTFGDSQSSLTESGLGVISHGYYFIINITDGGFTLSGQYANCYTYKKKYVYYAFG